MVFICSPYRGDVARNIENAQHYCQIAIKAGKIPIAPHLYFPQFLDDNDPTQRRIGIFYGLELMKLCDEVWVFGKEMTEGMRQEIAHAEGLGMQVTYF